MSVLPSVLGASGPKLNRSGTVVDAGRLAVLHHMDVDRGREQEAGVEQVEGELVLLVLPERLVRIEAEVAVLVIGERFPARRHGDANVFPGLLGQRFRQLADMVLREGLLLDIELRRLGKGRKQPLLQRPLATAASRAADPRN